MPSTGPGGLTWGQGDSTSPQILKENMPQSYKHAKMFCFFISLILNSFGLILLETRGSLCSPGWPQTLNPRLSRTTVLTVFFSPPSLFLRKGLGRNSEFCFPSAGIKASSTMPGSTMPSFLTPGFSRAAGSEVVRKKQAVSSRKQVFQQKFLQYSNTINI